MRCVRDLREARMQGSGLRHSGIAADLCAHNVTPHIAHNISGRRTAVDGRTTRPAGYAVSQRKRKRIKEPFGWARPIGALVWAPLRVMPEIFIKQ